MFNFRRVILAVFVGILIFWLAVWGLFWGGLYLLGVSMVEPKQSDTS